MLVVNRIPRTIPQAQLHDEFNQMFEQLWTNIARPTTASGPAMNVWEDEGAFYIESELPGMSMNDVDVTVLDDQVTIKGTRTLTEPENGRILRRERRGGTFNRTWTLPTAVAADGVSATLKDGVLLVTLPKAPQAKPRRIEVTPGRS
jgi:HSP20 family protein